MQPGEVVGGRFELEHLAGTGGMGAVWRALDRRTGTPVALKLVTEVRSTETKRFLQEAMLLASIDHPAVVGHVAHGVDGAGRPWLAMRWLEGEDLSERLERGPLDADATIAVGLRVAEALATVHGHGIIHRDVKPPNVWLESGSPHRAVLLDLGVARPFERRTRLTGSNEVLGTVGYLAPEQVEGAEAIDARADLFALGCVLHECLAGEPAFAGPHPLAVLAKLLLVVAPSLEERAPGAPPELVALVTKLLAKDPGDRPPSAIEVARELASIARPSRRGALASTIPPPRAAPLLGTAELRVVTFLLVEPRPVEGDGRTRDEAEHLKERREADAIAATGGAKLRWSGETFAFAVVDRGETPGDRAVRAARLALELAARPWVLRALVATGRMERVDPLPVGPVIDRASALLRGNDGPEGAFVDAATEALLDGEVVLVGPPERRRVVGRVTAARAPRTILGRALPCLGRERELAMLDAAWTGVLEERRARVVLVTGAAGVGKTRLASEWTSRLAPDVKRIAASADVMRGGALDLAADLVRDAIAQPPFDGGSDRGEQLARHAAAIGLEDARIVAFLGELVGAPIEPAQPIAALRAARSDPRLHAEWLERAFLAFMDATLVEPVVFFVEDLAWADDASIEWLDRALRRFEGRPWLLVATSRPQVEERFPSLWRDAEPQRLVVGRLPHAAATELVRLCAEPHLDQAAREEIVKRAHGHAFLLEELVRHAVVAGQAIPDSVLAMVQLRLDRLVAIDRRLLRLASVLGERFAEDDLASLAGDDARTGLGSLERAEVVCPAAEPGRWSFRHALVREAAYASLSDDDRRRAHAEAADLLARRGESPDVLALHYEAGGRQAEAAGALVSAARRALERGAPAAALTLAERAAPLADDDVLRARSWAYASGAASMIGDLPRASRLGADAMKMLSPVSEEWFLAAYGPFLASYQLDTSQVPRVTEALLATPPASVPPTILSAYAFSACILVLYGVAGMRPAAQAIARLGLEVAQLHGFEAEPFLRPFETVLAVVGLREDDVAEGRRRAAGAMGWCDAVGAEGLLHMAQVFATLAALEVGRGRETLPALRAARRGLTARRNLQHAHWAFSVELRVLATEPVDDDEAARALGHREEAPTPYHGGWWLTQRAMLLAALGRLDEAAAETERFLAGPFALFDAWARTLAARAALAKGYPDDALMHVRAFDELAQAGQGYPVERSWIDLVRVEALRAAGKIDAADAALAAAAARVESRASRLALEDRDSYLARIAPNAKLLGMKWPTMPPPPKTARDAADDTPSAEPLTPRRS